MSPHGNGPPRCACPRLPARVRWRQHAWQGNPAREESVMSQWQAVVLLALVAPALAASAEEQPKPKERKVSLRLSFSVEEYDPSRPSKAVIKCVVQNDTPVALHVPVGFDDGYVRLESEGLTLRKVKKEKD